jgi:prepilin peptidase CpaA
MLASVALAICAAALAAAGANDLVRYRIPNSLCLAVVAAFVVLVPSLPLATTASHAATGLAVLAATSACFALGLMGGGDAKLLAATALWMGWGYLLPFVLLTSLAGAALGLTLLVARRHVRRPLAQGRWYSRLLSDGEGVPYGVAISAAALSLLPRLAPDLLH